jgi:molecular chaperone DnaK
MQKLREAAEKAKIALSEHESVKVHVPLLSTDEAGYALDLSTEIGRQDLSKMTIDLVQGTFKVCDEALHAAGISAGEVDQVVLVGGSTRIPLVRKSVEHYFGRPPLTTVNPDEVVALGAAIQAHLLLGDSKSSVLLDVTPLSLRIGTVGGYTEAIVDRNTPVPIERTRVFTTASDNQELVRIKVYQGESNRAEENTLLGEFEFSGFPPRPRGETEVEVTFDINTDGILQVVAKEQESGAKTSTRINLSAGLSEREVEEAALRNEGLSLVSVGGA